MLAGWVLDVRGDGESHDEEVDRTSIDNDTTDSWVSLVDYRVRIYRIDTM